VTVEFILSLVAIAASVITASIHIANFRRIGNWRTTDAGKEMQGRMSSAETRLTVAETKMRGAPTAADLSSLKAHVAGIEKSVGVVAAGVDRIEDYLLRDKK